MQKNPPSIELPSELSYRALLGLVEPAGLDGDVMRNIQARGMRQRNTLRIALNLTFAIMVLVLYRGIAPAWAQITWAGLFCGFHLYTFSQVGTRWVWDRPQYNREDVRRLHTHSAITAIMWGSAFAFLGTSGTIMENAWPVVNCSRHDGIRVAAAANGADGCHDLHWFHKSVR